MVSSRKDQATMGDNFGIGDDEIAEFIYDSGHECSRCREKIMLVEEVYLLWVVAARMNGSFQILPVESDEGDFLYPPQYFCFSCWEDNCEDLSNLENEIHQINDERGVCECIVCNSDILLNESFGQPILGEIRCSPRMPNDETTYYFHRLQKSELCICISCLKLLNDSVIEMWEEGVDQEGECEQGTHWRCWRSGCTKHCEMND